MSALYWGHRPLLLPDVTRYTVVHTLPRISLSEQRTPDRHGGRMSGFLGSTFEALNPKYRRACHHLSRPNPEKVLYSSLTPHC